MTGQPLPAHDVATANRLALLAEMRSPLTRSPVCELCGLAHREATCLDHALARWHHN